MKKPRPPRKPPEPEVPLSVIDGRLERIDRIRTVCRRHRGYVRSRIMLHGIEMRFWSEADRAAALRELTGDLLPDEGAGILDD